MAVLISESHAKCYVAFENLVDALHHPVRDFLDQLPLKMIEEEFDKYKVWAGNVGAPHAGKRYEISLDYRLREASFFKNQVLGLLQTLDDKLSRAAGLVRNERKSFEEHDEESDDGMTTTFDAGYADQESEDSPWEISSDSSQDREPAGQSGNMALAAHGSNDSRGSTSSMSNIIPLNLTVVLGRTPNAEMTRLLESIKLTIACLYRIPVRKPAPVDRLKHKKPVDLSWFQHFDVMYVKDKFPSIDSNVAARLGKMITRRRQLLHYREAHHQSLETGHVQSNPKPEAARATFLKEAKEIGSQETPSLMASSQAASSHFTLRSKATTFRPGGTLVHPSQEDLDPTVLYAPSLAESNSVASSFARNDILIRVPARPKGDDGAEQVWFECPYCLITKMITTERKWKKHIFEDLQPYVCTYEDCNLYDYFFESKDTWWKHETQHHRTKWFCNTEFHPEYDSESDLLIHMKAVHNHGLDHEQFDLLKDTFRRPSRSIGGTCNLCMRHSKSLKNHMSRHLQQIALFALPRVNETAGSDKAESCTNSYEHQDNKKNDGQDESEYGIPYSRSHDVADEHASEPNMPDMPDIDDDYEVTNVPETATENWDDVTEKFSNARRPETPPRPFCAIPFRRDPDFVDRETLLDQIYKKCSVPESRIALVGLGGIGKTQLAIELCYRTAELSTYRNQGRWDEAEELFVQVTETSKKKLGADHPDTLTSMANLASTYWSQGRWEAAEALQVEVMETYKTKLGADHPDTLTSMANLASTYWSQGRWEAAEALQMQVMESSKTKLGADHPDTLTSMANLASTYWSQGRREAAEALQVEVTETFKKKIGADHPDTLTSMNNLAFTWKSQGRDAEAVSLMRHCAQSCSRNLGADHPYSISSSTVLAEWEVEQTNIIRLAENSLNEGNS